MTHIQVSVLLREGLCSHAHTHGGRAASTSTVYLDRLPRPQRRGQHGGEAGGRHGDGGRPRGGGRPVAQVRLAAGGATGPAGVQDDAGQRPVAQVRVQTAPRVEPEEPGGVELCRDQWTR